MRQLLYGYAGHALVFVLLRCRSFSLLPLVQLLGSLRRLLRVFFCKDNSMSDQMVETHCRWGHNKTIALILWCTHLRLISCSVK